MIDGISVIIPTYNREQYLNEAIQSVISQDFEGVLEVIISDDGSSDETLKIAESFGSRIKILRKPKNCTTQGVSGTRNRGIEASTQPFICFLDSDDFYLEGHLKKIAQIFENNQNLGFAFCRILEVKEEDGKNLFKQWTHKRIFKNDIKNPVVSRGKIVHTNSIIFRREVFEKVGNFNLDFSHGEDGDLWMRISEQFRGEFSNHYGAVYRIQHENNQLTKNSNEQIRKCHIKVQENAIKRYYELGLKDSNRIFELKHLSIHGQYKRNNKLIYYFQYLKLICMHPITFLRRILDFYYEISEMNESKKWYTLQKFIN